MYPRSTFVSKMVQRLTLAIGVAASGYGSANAESQITKQDVWAKSGEWVVLVDTPDHGGCFMERSFEDGTLMKLGLKTISHEGYFMVLNKAWENVQEGDLGEIYFDFGDEVFGGDAIGVIEGDFRGGKADFNNPDLVTELANRVSFVVSGSAKVGFEYALKGTKLAIAETDVCRVEQRSR